MKKIIKLIGLVISMCILFSCFGCDRKESSGENTNEPSQKTLQLAAQKDWVNVTTYDDTAKSAYMQPIWYTREIYDESVVFIGKNSSANLLYMPSGSVTVRDYQLKKTYVEGRDYIVEGKKITRVEGGDLPYFNEDDYFLKNPGVVEIRVDASKCEFDFEENRYLYYGEGTSLTKNHLVISYKTDEMWQGEIPQGQTDKVGNFMDKVKSGQPATVMFYGDSITVGCNASGTAEGGKINPYLPSWPNLVTSWLADKYGGEITNLNEAVGGWQAKDGMASFSQKVLPKAENIDLLVLAFGMNDAATARETYAGLIGDMAGMYFEKNPDGAVLLVSPMNPNTQSVWVGNQRFFEEDLLKIAKDNDNIAVAQVNTVFTQLEASGKRTRDWLANNINHPNDFGVRIYAQVILKTLAGNDFCEEIYA